MNGTLDPLTWAAILMLVGLALAVLEVFVPSGGILGFLSGTAILLAIVLAFYHSGPAYGFGFTAVAVLVLPAAVALAFKYWPKTPLGRRFLLGLPTDDEVLPDRERVLALKSLVGKIGEAKTPMLPSGAIVVEGRTMDAVSQGMPIDPGQSVRVVEVRGNRIVVRPLRPGESDRAAPAGDDLLSRPLDEFGLDDPLAT